MGVAIVVASAPVASLRPGSGGSGGCHGADGVIHRSVRVGPRCCAGGLPRAAGVVALVLGPRRCSGHGLTDGAVGVASLAVVPWRRRWLWVLHGACAGGPVLFVGAAAVGARFAAVCRVGEARATRTSRGYGRWGLGASVERFSVVQRLSEFH